jgi:hypothetical protein
MPGLFHTIVWKIPNENITHATVVWTADMAGKLMQLYGIFRDKNREVKNGRQKSI